MRHHAALGVFHAQRQGESAVKWWIVRLYRVRFWLGVMVSGLGLARTETVPGGDAKNGPSLGVLGERPSG